MMYITGNQVFIPPRKYRAKLGHLGVRDQYIRKSGLPAHFNLLAQTAPKESFGQSVQRARRVETRCIVSLP